MKLEELQYLLNTFLKSFSSSFKGLFLLLTLFLSFKSFAAKTQLNEVKPQNILIKKVFIKKFSKSDVKSNLDNNTKYVKKNSKNTSKHLISKPLQSNDFATEYKVTRYDLPITYNSKVKDWIEYYQGKGRNWYKNRLERSYRYLPLMKEHMKAMKIPLDLSFVSMIESGFSPHATSTADAVGYWQFIEPTALRYGLKIQWWVDERRDFIKSSKAAASYLSDLYKIFQSWYLTAAAYNMGEGRLKRLIDKHNTDNFWVLSKKKDFPKETREYIPKLIAAMLIAKNPQLYGFRDLNPMKPYSYEYFSVPGGTDLYQLAFHLGVSKKDIMKLNPELIQGLVPHFISSHRIRIPKGTTTTVSKFVRKKLVKNL